MARPGATVVAALILLFAPATGAAEQYAPSALTASGLLERNRHAAGSLLPGEYHVVKQMQSDKGDVWTYDTYVSAGDYRTSVRQGGLVWSYGRYAGHPWSQDANGYVIDAASSLEENDPLVTSLANPQNPTSGVKLLGLTTGSSPQFALAVTPRSGLEERRYYDAQSYLLTRIELVDYDGHKQVWDYGDYQKTFGSNVARLITYKRDGTAVTTQTRVVSYERVAPGPSLAIPASRRLFDLGSSESVPIPAEFTSEGIFVPITIGNRMLDFQLDSGSSDLLIDPQVATELGMPQSGAVSVSFGGDFTIANTRAPSVTIGTLSANDVAFSTAAFQEQLPLRRVVGLLGTDFIGSGVLEVNFEKQTLTMYRSLPSDLAAKGWSVLSIRTGSSVPVLKAAFSGQDGYFVVDLGAMYTTLFPHYFARFPNIIPRDLRDEEEMETLAKKPFGITHITMKSLVIGDWVFGGVQAVVPSASYAQERDFDGLIGREVLGSFNLIFDYADQQLWFKPIDVK